MAKSPSSQAVELRDVRFGWQGHGGFTLELDEFQIRKGERVLLTAPSGAGKSTLIALTTGLARPQSGKILVAGTDIVPLSQARRDLFRAEHIGLIFQSFNLVPYLSALDNIVLPLHFAPKRLQRAGGPGGARDEARAMMEAIGLPQATFGNKRASQLSVGQQQRVAALRAMIGAPDLIIADEPTSSLDPDRQRAFLKMLDEQLANRGSSLLMVSHDLALAGHFDRTVALQSFARSGQGQ